MTLYLSRVLVVLLPKTRKPALRDADAEHTPCRGLSGCFLMAGFLVWDTIWPWLMLLLLTTEWLGGKHLSSVGKSEIPAWLNLGKEMQGFLCLTRNGNEILGFRNDKYFSVYHTYMLDTLKGEQNRVTIAWPHMWMECSIWEWQWNLSGHGYRVELGMFRGCSEPCLSACLLPLTSWITIYCFGPHLLARDILWNCVKHSIWLLFSSLAD